MTSSTAASTRRPVTLQSFLFACVFGSFVCFYGYQMGYTEGQRASATTADGISIGNTGNTVKVVKNNDDKSRETEIHNTIDSDKNSASKQEVDDDGTIKAIALLGERNSGTRWTYSVLQECFGQDLIVKPKLSRWKHWFQIEQDGVKHQRTLVVAQFRSPYYWVEAMRKVPHHSPSHLHLDWHDFVTTPWTSPRSARDLTMKDQKGRVCQEKFHFNEIVSCLQGTREEYNITKSRFSNHSPQYELQHNGSGEPYKSIIDLRKDKIHNHMSTGKYDYVESVITVKYDDLLAKGNEFLIRQVENLTGVKAKCVPTPAQNRKVRALDPEFIVWMNNNVDWTAEERIGFQKMEVNEFLAVKSGAQKAPPNKKDT